jgi:hypothetical protein
MKKKNPFKKQDVAFDEWKKADAKNGECPTCGSDKSRPIHTCMKSVLHGGDCACAVDSPSKCNSFRSRKKVVLKTPIADAYRKWEKETTSAEKDKAFLKWNKADVEKEKCKCGSEKSESGHSCKNGVCTCAKPKVKVPECEHAPMLSYHRPSAETTLSTCRRCGHWITFNEETHDYEETTEEIARSRTRENLKIMIQAEKAETMKPKVTIYVGEQGANGFNFSLQGKHLKEWGGPIRGISIGSQEPMDFKKVSDITLKHVVALLSPALEGRYSEIRFKDAMTFKLIRKMK